MPRIYTRLPWQERLWSKIRLAPGDGCWLWQASTDRHGYGMLQMPRESGKPVNPGYAHRLSYQSAYGVDPGSKCVLHKCDTPLCCRPDHLFLGTRTENAADKVAKGRVPCGESMPQAKLTERAVIAIRERSASESQRSLAREYGVDRSVISRIVNFKRWRSVRPAIQ